MALKGSESWLFIYSCSALSLDAAGYRQSIPVTWRCISRQLSKWCLVRMGKKKVSLATTQLAGLHLVARQVSKSPLAPRSHQLIRCSDWRGALQSVSVELVEQRHNAAVLPYVEQHVRHALFTGNVWLFLFNQTFKRKTLKLFNTIRSF